MKPEELQAMRDRANKATPYPFDVAEDKANGRLVILDGTQLQRHIAYVPLDGVESVERAWANAELFANARKDILRLADEVERLKANNYRADFEHYRDCYNRALREIDRLRGEIQWFMEQAGWADEDEPREYGLLIPSHEGREVYERFRAALEGGENA